MKHKGEISISRPQCSDGSEYIAIRLVDVDAGIGFVDVKIGYAEFTEALTGMSNVKCQFSVNELQYVGKKCERESLVFPFECHSYKEKSKLAFEEAKKCCPEGWTPSRYFGSQNSFFSHEGKSWARTLITRWVDKEDGE